jgi:hypothetical protein
VAFSDRARISLARDQGTATTGYRGTATAGDRGEMVFRYWDGKRFREIASRVGENGLLPDVPYHLVEGVITRTQGGP